MHAHRWKMINRGTQDKNGVLKSAQGGTLGEKYYFFRRHSFCN